MVRPAFRQGCAHVVAMREALAENHWGHGSMLHTNPEASSKCSSGWTGDSAGMSCENRSEYATM